MPPLLPFSRWVFVSLWAIPVGGMAQSVTITVDPAQVVRTVDERVFGVNAVMWDTQTASAQTLSLLQAADIRTIRIPGGSLSDEYHWRTNTTAANTWTWSAGFDSFTQLITGLKASAFVTVNYGSGTPEEAAAWVAYANASEASSASTLNAVIGTDAKGYNWQTVATWANLRAAKALALNDGMNFLRLNRPSAIGLKYWEIGNENYGTWETDQQAVPHDAYTYAVRAKAYSTKMKAVDPTIKIGVVAVVGETDYANGNTSHLVTNPRTGLVRSGWTPVMLSTLKALGVTPDFLIYHRYEQAPAADTPGNPESDARLLQAAKTWAADAANLRQQLTDYLGAAGAGVELVATENNSVYNKPGKQTTSLVNGLFLADSVGQLLQTEFNALVWWDLRNGQETSNNNSAALYGWRNYGDYGILSGSSEPYPTYYAMKLLTNFARGGDTIVRATSSSDLLGVYAAKRLDGTLSLLVINKDPANTLNASLTLTGYNPPARAQVCAYGIPQDNAAKLGGSGSVDVATGSMAIAGSTFTASFAPYTAAVISFGGSTETPTPTPTPTPTVNTGGSAGGGGGAPSGWFMGMLILLWAVRRSRCG